MVFDSTFLYHFLVEAAKSLCKNLSLKLNFKLEVYEIAKNVYFFPICDDVYLPFMFANICYA